MKTIQLSIAVLMLTLFSISCSKDEDSNKPAAIAAVQPNTLDFKGNPIVFNGLSIDDDASNGYSEYILTTLSNLSMVFYCKYIGNGLQGSNVGTVTYTTDAINYFPVNNYPQLCVRGYINYQGSVYETYSGQIKIKRNATGNQTIEFVNLTLRSLDGGTLNGTINLPKN